jgi:hypothetical protein
MTGIGCVLRRRKLPLNRETELGELQMPLIAIAHFSQADFWYCEQISGQRSN